jgi:hypothetical protein
VEDLDEDTRRWFRDRDARLTVELERLAWDHAARGVTESSIAARDKLVAKHAALTEYRDEISRKRRRYRQLREAEGGFHEWLREQMPRRFARFALTDDQRAVLAKWRADVKPSHMPNDSASVDDPTSEEREPALRRFEEDGDPPL